MFKSFSFQSHPQSRSSLSSTATTNECAGPEAVSVTEMKAANILKDKVQGSLVCFCVGDALAMPVHWYYDLRQLVSDFGPRGVMKYEAPKVYISLFSIDLIHQHTIFQKQFPGSILNLSNTGGGGRGSDKGDIIGGVIMHGKKQFWMRGGQYHYHHGMAAGENTLDAQLARLMTRTITRQKV